MVITQAGQGPLQENRLLGGVGDLGFEGSTDSIANKAGSLDDLLNRIFAPNRRVRALQPCAIVRWLFWAIVVACNTAIFGHVWQWEVPLLCWIFALTYFSMVG